MISCRMISYMKKLKKLGFMFLIFKNLSVFRRPTIHPPVHLRLDLLLWCVWKVEFWKVAKWKSFQATEQARALERQKGNITRIKQKLFKLTHYTSLFTTTCSH